MAEWVFGATEVFVVEGDVALIRKAKHISVLDFFMASQSFDRLLHCSCALSDLIRDEFHIWLEMVRITNPYQPYWRMRNISSQRSKNSGSNYSFGQSNFSKFPIHLDTGW